MKKKVMILLHGFKRNNEDDFGRVWHYFEKLQDEYEIKNVIWYDNYNKKTLNRKHLVEVINKVADEVNAMNPEEIVIVGYSTGNVVAMYLMDRLPNKDNIRYFGAVPPFEVEYFKWVQRLKELGEYKKKLRKRLGYRRYRRLQKKMKKERKTEKYPIRIANYVYFKIIKPDAWRMKNINNGYFLLALDDQVVNTKVAFRELDNGTNDISVKDFKHDQLLKLNQEVFLEWFDKKFKIKNK